MSYALAFIGFALLIVLHEAGHFVAAKAVGMRVERFSLFFGPMWLKRTVGETTYGVGVIPLGGYVKITGMTSGEVYETPEIEARAYMNQPVWKRIVVITAGPVVNIALAFVLAWTFFVSSQTHVVGTTPTIAYVEPHSVAATALKPGDVLVSVDGVKGSAAAMHAQIRSHTCRSDAQVNGCTAASAATVVVDRAGRLHTYHLRPRYSSAAHEPLLGFIFLSKVAHDSAGYAVGASVSGLWRVTKATVSDIAQIFKPKVRQQLSGIVGAYRVTQQSFATSTADALEVLALISLSLGVLNLMPFLPLDGGHIFWAIVEKLRGKRVPFVVMERAGLVGVALILMLFAIGLSNDLSSHAASLSSH